MKKTLPSKKLIDIHSSELAMPEDVRKSFFSDYEHIMSNNVWVEHQVGISLESVNGEMSILDAWILKETDAELWENVLISHWW